MGEDNSDDISDNFCIKK